jgi:hypothetical protein
VIAKHGIGAVGILGDDVVQPVVNGAEVPLLEGCDLLFCCQVQALYLITVGGLFGREIEGVALPIALAGHGMPMASNVAERIGCVKAVALCSGFSTGGALPFSVACFQLLSYRLHLLLNGPGGVSNVE